MFCGQPEMDPLVMEDPLDCGNETSKSDNVLEVIAISFTNCVKVSDAFGKNIFDKCYYSAGLHEFRKRDRTEAAADAETEFGQFVGGGGRRLGRRVETECREKGEEKRKAAVFC